ncbi:MAG: hypothetical protein F4X64_12475 [Chloroflexi bacterium]|nr:hypothetical protein [Chloroflexota bacterium]
MTVRLIVRRVKPTPGSQLALFHTYSYHGFITDRAGDTLELEADHRRHAEVENAIRDLKYGAGLNHIPSGRFPANAAWLAAQSLPRTRYGVMDHNLACWTASIAPRQPVVPTRPSASASSPWPDRPPARPVGSPCISLSTVPSGTSSTAPCLNCAPCPRANAFYFRGKAVVPAFAGTSNLASSLVSLKEVLEVQFGGRVRLPCTLPIPA